MALSNALKDAFNSQAPYRDKPFDYARDLGDNTPQASSGAPTSSILNSLTGYSFKANIQTQPKVSQQQSNVGNSAQISAQSVQSSMQQVSFVKGAAIAALKEASKEVNQAMNDIGHKGAPIFASTNTGLNVIGELSGGSGLTELIGLGTELKKLPEAKRSEVLGQIADQLRQSKNGVSPTLQEPGRESSASSSFDWNTFLDNHGEAGLDQLMAMSQDPHRLCPEVQELDNQEAELKNTQQLALQAEHNAQNNHTCDPQYFCKQTTQSLSNIEKCVIEMPVLSETITNCLKAAQATAPTPLLQQDLPSMAR